MTIPGSAIPTPITSPTAQQNFVDQNGKLTSPAKLALQQGRDFVVNMCRTFPCNSTMVNTGGTSTITLTLLSVQPNLTQYADFDSFGFVASTSSTGTVVAKVVTAQATLAQLPVYISNGATPAGGGDVAHNGQYFLTYVDSLNTTGGFVLR